MWSRLYRNHVLMAFPTYDSAKHAWVPQVDINWFVGPSHDSTFVRFPVRVLTEDEAVSWALSRGQAWIDIHVERLQGHAPKRRRMFDMIEAFNQGLTTARLRQPPPALAAPKRAVKVSLTFDEFAHLLAQKRFTFSVKTLQKSYAALVKVKKTKRWSWAETKRKVMRAQQQAPAPAGAPRRIPLSERAWGRIH